MRSFGVPIAFAESVRDDASSLLRCTRSVKETKRLHAAQPGPDVPD